MQEQLTQDFKSKKDIERLDKEFDLLIDIIDEINCDQKSIIKIKFDDNHTNEYDTSKLEDLRRLYIDTNGHIDEDFEDRIDNFLLHFIDNWTLARSVANLIYERIISNQNNKNGNN